MTDITTEFSELLTSRNARGIASRDGCLSAEHITDDFLKEAYRIVRTSSDETALALAQHNEHISSLLAYLRSIRQSYLAIGPRPTVARRQQQRQLTDEERNQIDSETTALLQELSASISNLASAENLRRETQATILLKKFPLANSKVWKWASGIAQDGRGRPLRSEEQERLEGQENTIKTVRESVLWTLRTGLESVAEVQRHMVEKRVERINEKEKSILYNMNKHGAVPTVATTSTEASSFPPTKGENALQEDEAAEIESQLSPEQLQLFAEENNDMLRHYEDTLDKAQNVEKSLLEITSLQQTLVSHLTTQDEMITQLVADAGNTQTNVTKGNRELKRASERKSVARWVFYGTAGLCASLVVWDAIF
ncbi:eukaryotic translation initiation factor 3 subunit A [Ascosphaera pollenicola]|nr:eukaryotic translation initiation factor 3 subunit A [Ascosphaera pollenicola]